MNKQDLRNIIREILSEEEVAQISPEQQKALEQSISMNLKDLFGDIKSFTPVLKNDKELEKEVIDATKEISEGLGMGIGLALSLGKIGELAGAGLSKVGKKMSSDNALINIGNFLKKYGHKYTHGIEGGIIKILETIPTTKTLMDNLTPEQKDILAKAILTSIVGFLAISSGAETVEALAHGKGLLAAIEGALTGVKSAEIGSNIPKIIKGVIEHVLGTK